MNIGNIIDYQKLAFDRAIELYKARYTFQRPFEFELMGILVDSSFVIVTFMETKTTQIDRQMILFSELDLSAEDWDHYVATQTQISEWKEGVL